MARPRERQKPARSARQGLFLLGMRQPARDGSDIFMLPELAFRNRFDSAVHKIGACSLRRLLVVKCGGLQSANHRFPSPRATRGGSTRTLLAAVVADQVALCVADLVTDVTPPSATKDDQAPQKGNKQHWCAAQASAAASRLSSPRRRRARAAKAAFPRSAGRSAGCRTSFPRSCRCCA